MADEVVLQGGGVGRGRGQGGLRLGQVDVGPEGGCGEGMDGVEGDAPGGGVGLVGRQLGGQEGLQKARGGANQLRLYMSFDAIDM